MADFVLVHGAGTGGWLWDDVAGCLRQDGHRVYAPTLSGVGERTAEGSPATDVSAHVRELIELIEREALSQLVLVGFSYGGFVLAGVASQLAERVARVIYVDAFLPVPGRSFLDLLTEPVRATMLAAAAMHGDGWKIPPAPIEMVGGIGAVEAGVDPAHVATALQRRGFHPLGTYQEVFTGEPVPASVPHIYVSCTDKPAGDPLMAIAAGLGPAWIVHRLPTGHFSMLSMPHALSAILEQE